MGECAKLAKYLRNRAPGLVLAQKSVLPRLEALAEPWSVQAVSLGCICWYLVRELHKRPAHARRRALSRHLLGAYVVCRNPDQARKDAATREQILAALESKLRSGGPKSVVANKGYKRYLKAEKGAFAVDLDKARDEQRFDGMWVLRTNTELSAVEIALRYKQLWMVEQIFRTAKSLLDTRPIFHKTDATICGHVFCSFLALVLRDELFRRMDNAGVSAEWDDILRDLNALTETAITYKGKTFVVRSNYRYLVVSRERTRHFDAEAAVRIETASSHGVHLHKVLSEDAQEVRLYCFSEERAAKERGIVERFAKRFEDALTKLSEGLSKPRTQKRLDKVWQRIGRLKAQSRGVAQHYDVELDTDNTGQRATAVRFTRRPVSGTMMTHPGVYCLRSNQTDWDEATLWRTYFTLTDLEAVFRSLKSELGLRPIYHHKPIRAEGHLFITVIAYQLVQVIRRRLRESGETASWTTLRRVLEGQQRITATFRRCDGRTLHVRKATRAEAPQQAIYDALGVGSAPGGIRKSIV